MKADSCKFTENQRAALHLRIFFATTATAAILLAAGCSSPVEGPTNPKAFIGQGREWTYSGQDSTPPATPAPTTAPASGDAATVPPPNG